MKPAFIIAGLTFSLIFFTISYSMERPAKRRRTTCSIETRPSIDPKLPSTQQQSESMCDNDYINEDEDKQLLNEMIDSGDTGGDTFYCGIFHKNKRASNSFDSRTSFRRHILKMHRQRYICSYNCGQSHEIKNLETRCQKSPNNFHKMIFNRLTKRKAQELRELFGIKSTDTLESSKSEDDTNTQYHQPFSEQVQTEPQDNTDIHNQQLSEQEQLNEMLEVLRELDEENGIKHS